MDLERLAAWLDPIAPALGTRALGLLGDLPVRVVLWDGRAIGAPAERAPGTVYVADRLAFLRLLADPDVQFGELWVEGRLRLEGDRVRLVTEIFRADLKSSLLRSLLPERLIEGVLRTDGEHARENAQHHYDVGNDFYALWLDERMVYTCAFFPDPETTLEDAQVAKLERVSRKLALRPGQRVLELGSGWGALALHMAREHGVHVRAYNVSHEQVLHAREQAEKRGLADRVEFVEDDWRAARGSYDRVVSLGMLEHVGPSHYDALAARIDACLAPDGLALLHTIGRARPMPLSRWLRRRVFPNAHPPALSEMLEIVEPHGFVTLDVENLRHHYELTSAHWLARFEAGYARAVRLVGEERARTWHLYLLATVAGFRAPTLELFQLLFTRRRSAQIPWSRAHVESGEPARIASVPEPFRREPRGDA